MPISCSTNELEFITGSGVSENFSNSYFPRDLNCGVFYHFGERLNGDCSSGKIQITAKLSTTQFELRNDTSIDIDDTIVYKAPSGYNSYFWSTGSSISSEQIIASDVGLSIHYVSVQFIDSLGCLKSDSIILGITDLEELVGVKERTDNVVLFPNPAFDILHFSQPFEEILIEDALGKIVLSQKGNFDQVAIDLLQEGFYFVLLTTNYQSTVLNFVKKQ
ncbi:MAG: hypothetical protein ACI9O4_002137 [Chitinophagales bacterium]|jgi:hypothetical protein